MVKDLFNKIFSKPFVVRWFVLRNTILIAVLIGAANFLYDFDQQIHLWHNYEPVFNIVKDTLFQILTVSSIGFILHKYFFCEATMISFCWIVYSKIVWFVNEHIYELGKSFNEVDGMINVCFFVAVIYKVIEQLVKKKIY